MENQKSTETDDVTIEFYKEKYNLLEDDLHQSYTNILFQEKESPITMKQAIITLLPQKDDLEQLRYLETYISFMFGLKNTYSPS